MASYGSQVQVEWHGPEFEAATVRATRRGLRAAAAVFLARVAVNINRAGTPTSKTGRRLLALGQSLIGLTGESAVQRRLARMASKRNDRAIRSAEAIEAAGGGLVDPPGGMPRRRTGTLLRSLTQRDDGDGVIAGAASEYAAVHEFGGGNNIPARPYIRPSLNQASEAMVDAFVAAVREETGLNK